MLCKKAGRKTTEQRKCLEFFSWMSFCVLGPFKTELSAWFDPDRTAKPGPHSDLRGPSWPTFTHFTALCFYCSVEFGINVRKVEENEGEQELSAP